MGYLVGGLYAFVMISNGRWDLYWLGVIVLLLQFAHEVKTGQIKL